MSKSELSQLAIAKKLADDSGRHLSECMEEAAEIIIRRQNAPRLGKVRIFYSALAGTCLLLVLQSVLNILNIEPAFPETTIFGLLAFVLTSMFWVTPEIPLMLRLWTRWNTPAFIAAMGVVLFIDLPRAEMVNDLAIVLFMAVAGFAAVNGARNPDHALEKRSYTTKYLFHKLSATDQGRIFFLAPWLTTFGFGGTKRS